MKIIYSIHQFFPQYYTGTERYLLNLATMMQKFGHEVSIITYNPDTNLNDYTRQGDVYITKYSYHHIPVTGVKLVNENEYVSFNVKRSPIDNYVTEFLKQEKPDIFHITHPMRMTSAFWVAKGLKIKTVMTLTDYWMMCGKGILLRNNNSPCVSPDDGNNCKKFCYQHLESKVLRERVHEAKKIFKSADALIASAQYLVELFNYNQYDTSKLHLIRHGFNYFDNYKIETSKQKNVFTIVSTGSLLPHKGVHLLIEAFKKIKNKNLKLKIYGTTYGNSSYMDFLVKLVGKDTRISFEGAYSIENTSGLHQDADLVVQPSMWYETYPLVCVASLAYGVPIVVPDMTGASELVEQGKNGYIFKFGDANSLFEQLSLAISDQLKYNQSITYHQTVESEAVSTEAVYNKLMTNQHA